MKRFIRLGEFFVVVLFRGLNCWKISLSMHKVKNRRLYAKYTICAFRFGDKMRFLNCSYKWVWINCSYKWSVIAYCIQPSCNRSMCFMNEAWYICFPFGSLLLLPTLCLLPTFFCLSVVIIWAVSCCRKWPIEFLIMWFHIMTKQTIATQQITKMCIISEEKKKKRKKHE